MRKLLSGALLAAVFLVPLSVGPLRAETPVPPDAADGRLLYVAAPGIRNDLQYGGAGILIFDIDHGHKFVRRIETPASREAKPDNIKGVCANADTKKLYFTTTKKLYCMDLQTEQTLWEKALPGGCDRMAMTPDGKTLYVPSFEGPTWNVVDAATGDVLAVIETNSGAHNTVCGFDGKRMYLAGLKSPLLRVADTATNKVVHEIGPFGGSIRPFTVNAAQTRCFVTVNDLLGFEIGDLTTGKVLARVEITGFKKGPVARHGCPSHGVGLTPDEKEIWVCDAANRRLHVFDATATPPRQVASIKLREEPGWVTFSLDGRYAYPSTGDVIDVATREVLTGLRDEKGRADGRPVRRGPGGEITTLPGPGSPLVRVRFLHAHFLDKELVGRSVRIEP
jgi:DNA-binding beta-propeller fold protein YncE